MEQDLGEVGQMVSDGSEFPHEGANFGGRAAEAFSGESAGPSSGVPSRKGAVKSAEQAEGARASAAGRPLLMQARRHGKDGFVEPELLGFRTLPNGLTEFPIAKVFHQKPALPRLVEQKVEGTRRPSPSKNCVWHA
jgi:hypothetical protein